MKLGHYLHEATLPPVIKAGSALVISMSVLRRVPISHRRSPSQGTANWFQCPHADHDR